MASAVFSVIGVWQDAPPINAAALKPWNPLCEVSFDKWLVDSHCAESKERIKMMGNIVIPPQAAAGMAVLARVIRLNSEP